MTELSYLHSHGRHFGKKVFSWKIYPGIKISPDIQTAATAAALNTQAKLKQARKQQAAAAS